MKRSISHIPLFILLAMMLAGCSGDAPEVIAEPSTPKPVVSPDDGEIRFKVGTEWQGKGDTRALLFADADALVTEGSFKVYAYVGTTTNAHINGSTASYSEGEWVFTDGKHYWPQSESLNFVTYMPATAPDYITNIGYSADNGPSFDCANLPNNSTNQASTKEFLYAYERGKTKAADAANMSLTFHRPFSIVSLRLSKAHPGLTITSIKFKDIYNNGSFTYGSSPQWTPTGDLTDFTATIDSYTNSGSSPIPLGGPYLMMPQSFAGGQQTIEITATCSAWDPTSQTISISFPIEAWLPGQSYSYNISISGATMTMSISNWSSDDSWTDPDVSFDL